MDNSIKVNERHASHPVDFRSYDTQRLREEFLVDSVFEEESICLTYSYYDRLIVGGAMPVHKELSLDATDQLKSDFFCSRREAGIINLGGNGVVAVDGVDYSLGYQEAIYIPMGAESIRLKSDDSSAPSLFYINSAPAHKAFEVKKITREDANVMDLGSSEEANKRRIFQLIVSKTCDTCQLQMGLTSLETGSVWNTMPPHVHGRRMEAYMYTELDDNQAICHFMGDQENTRHIWMQNNQAVISPSWSIHSAVGTSNYTFIWGMAGENLDFTDMDGIKPADLR
ncbi:5-dehydro-4-deoxy-D-glucuronate isomerase [Bacteroidota bacterium]